MRRPAAALTLITGSLLIVLVVSSLTAAQSVTPAGRWRTVNDDTGKPESIVVITEVKGEMQGRVEQVFSPPAPNTNPMCDRCSPDRKGQPIVGMLIMWGMRKNGDEYTGGRLYDPNNGKTYRGKIRLIDGGKKLDVRGYIGISMFGRTQTWLREP
jgi:uncharacterized protein (DUF2147 family)